MSEVPEDFVFENGYRLQVVHLLSEGLMLRLSHPYEEHAAIELPQEQVIRFRNWLNKYYGLFFR